MRNCLIADILRVQRKKSYIIMISIVFAFMILASVLAGMKIFKGDMSKNFESFISVAVAFNSLMIGIPVFSSVISDDFKSKSMQTAIGHGMSRRKLVITRFVEFVVILAEAYLLFTLVIAGLGIGFGAKSSSIVSVCTDMWAESITIICCFAVSMFFSYIRQSGTIGLVIYIILSTNALDLALNALGSISFFKDHDINPADYMISGMKLNMVDSALGTASRIGWAAALICVYIILPLILTVRVFKHKELDF